ncbi:MAG: indolepyruvate ferredoxin oxidoreductase subunit alpha, partial [Clostridia bacterium]|nr:indolepyruvate ferredoxin oxidoreductase subunit alpha [Clostridia bacterium]
MKQLMLGNEAVARGLFEAGCSFVSSYPGTPSTEITECAAKYPEIYAEWAPNEKVAMEAAFGAALAGKRSFCGMKHVGLNVAADPLFTISYTGINAGMVIGVADDPGMHSSQNEQDSRHYAKAAKLPMLEPSNSKEALEFAKAAYELSESFDAPVLLKMCTRVAHSQSIVETSERVEKNQVEYVKNPSKYIMMPGFAKKRHPIVEERMAKLSEYALNSTLNKWEKGTDNKIGIITAGTCYQYVKEVCGNDVNILKLGMVWPISEKMIKEFAASVEKVIVVEELDGFIEEFCNALGIETEGKNLFSNIDELSQNKVAKGLGVEYTEGEAVDAVIPNRPPVMCAGCPHRGLYYVLSKLKLNVIGDIGCYTLGAVAPLNAVDSVICMGASISGAHGFNKANDGKSDGKTVAVI